MLTEARHLILKVAHIQALQSRQLNWQAVQASQFIQNLETQKTAIEQKLDIKRYPFNTLDNLQLVDRLFAASPLNLQEIISTGSILDVGCGDGDFGFYLSSEGHAVDLLDFEETNQNRMQMLRELSKALSGKHSVTSLDLDRGLNSLDSSYSFAIALGLIYHLKNLFLFLNDLATLSNFAVVSTRILHGAVLPDKAAAAYLVDDHELGLDNTNFWLFNSRGLQRLAERCGWTIVSRVRFGDLNAGDLHRQDAREALLLASNYSVFGGIRISYGLNRVEYGSYRWTQSKFGIEAKLESNGPGNLYIRYYLPESLLDHHKLSVSRNGNPIRVERSVGAKECLLRVPLDSNQLLVKLDIVCEHPTGNTDDKRPLGIVLQLDSKTPPIWLSNS